MNTHDSTNLFGDLTTDLNDVLAEFLAELDPKLLDLGWGFTPAKSVEYGLTDQSMANHVRNGVFAITRLNDIAPGFGGYELSDTELRHVIALFVIHDLHKLRGETTAHTEYDIDKAEVETLVGQLGLEEFAPSLRMEDFHACAVDHEDSWKSNPEHATRTYDKLRPFVRVADGFASCSTPEEAAGYRNASALEEAYPRANLELRHHTLDDVKGVFTNLLNGVTSTVLQDRGYELLLIYQDGCVYLTNTDTPDVQIDDALIGTIYDVLKTEITDAHPAYNEREQLADNLATRSLGFYGINDQDFFYAGAPNVLLAITVKADQDADPSDEPTDAMRETMETLDERLSIDIDTTTRVAPGYARLVYTVKRSFIDPLAEANIVDDALIATCRLFDVDEDVTNGLHRLREDEDLNLTAGGKWEYSYAIGQHVASLVRTNGWSPVAPQLAGFLAERLTAYSNEWESMVMDEHTGEFETELRAYLADILRIGGKASGPTDEREALSDPFEEHHTVRRGKTCTFCNRGTTSTRKSDMKAPKSLTTFQAGYSNRIPADAGQPEKLLVCIPCQIEFSLRETGATRRDDDRLFVHLIPDYFYTPTMWSLYADELFARFTGEAMTRTGRLATALFDAVTQIEDTAESTMTDEPTHSASMTTVLREATRGDDSGGRSVIEQLSQDFDVDVGFGTRTLSFYKPKDNETEFQFFGVFIGLAAASAMGLRAYISHSPLPDMRSRDFPEMVKLDAGFSAVSEFYRRDIPLSHLRERLGATAALVQLGYELARDDARFPKYLRVTRNKPLPGSYLLKRIAQNTDDGGTARYLLEEADYLDEYVTLEESHKH